ncbi:MAG: glucosyltransferase domain-containing protein [Acetatifactor sp.]|nr:glucosyltransferase domain-containing protein [Acetatifactor sp.]
MTVSSVFQTCRQRIKPKWKTAFFSALILGLLIHLPILVSDIPNHDGLDSIYFDQNMITSGRWFLMIACGASSYYTVPWVIGLLGILFLGMTSACLTELLEVEKTWAVVVISGLLVSFPALASTFAYVFTLDGYMFAMFLAVLAVLLTRKRKWGFLPGAVCLAFSLGTYQAYIAFAMLLSLACCVMICAEDGKIVDKVKRMASFLWMGLLGMTLYLTILRVLLRLQGKELAGYQGINGIAAGEASDRGLLSTIFAMYRDFFAFSLKGGVLFHNGLSLTAAGLLAAAVLLCGGWLAYRRKWWKSPLFFAIIVVVCLAVPLAANGILLISPGVNYHLLMRYQWILFPIAGVAFVSRCMEGDRFPGWMEWIALISGAALIFFYGVTDNIAYGNLMKKYEKTYAYCVRLLDRIEQTPGYYPGIPVAMIGVVGDEQFPVTDVTGEVTDVMIGMNGDYLLYTGKNYESFLRNYLGATLNILPTSAMEEAYYSEEYTQMESFPGSDSIRIIDGILYVKTENVTRN